MTIDSSANEAVEIVDEPALHAADNLQPPRHVPSPDDGATTPGGPIMVLIGTTIYVTYKVWRFRRRRARR